MLTIGHSFGGLIAHRATSSEFIGYAVRASDRDFASRLGDLVVLVNPAFEGARYEPLHVAGRRIESLKKDQLPTLIVATTSADKATRYAFPVARWLNTLFETTEGAEQDANVLAVGHNPRYRTHALATCDPKTDPRCRVACQPSEQRLQQASKALSTVKAEVLGEVEAMEKLGNEGFQQDTTYLCHGLKLDISPAPQVPPYNPYWVVTTTGDVMDGHNNIFNPNFVAFFRQMYVAVTAARVRNPATYRCVR